MKQFQTSCTWDLNLTDILAVNSQSFSGPFQGLVYQANYLVAGFPININGKYIAGAWINNLADGHAYRNNGTTAACNFIQLI